MTSVTSGRALLVIWLSALALRALYLQEISDAPFFDLRLGDAAAYHAWGRRIADGDWLGRDVFYQAPLYPYFLAAIYRVLGDSTMTVRIVQAIVGASSCALLAWAGMSLFGRAGAVAGVLLAFYPAAIYFDGLLEKSSLVIFFTTALLAALAIPGERVSWRRGLAAGVILGLLILTRENALLLAPVAFLWILIGASRGSMPARRAAAAAFVVGVLVTLLPVGLRNRAVGGEFHLTTSQLGPNFYIGNHPGATGTYEALVPGHGSAADEREDATRLAQQATGSRLSPAEVSSFWMRRALDFVRGQPDEWLRLTARKLALTFNAAEIADTESRDVHAEWSVLLRLLGPFGFGAVLGMATLGAVLSASSWRRFWFLYAIAATYAASIVMFFVLERYRIPIVPVLMVLAAGAVRVLPAMWRSHPRQAVVAMAAAIAAVACAHLPLAHERGARATHYSGIAAVLAGDPDRLNDAMEFYKRALKDSPDAPAAHFGLGTVLVKMGRAEEAVAPFRAAIASRPDYAEAHYNLGLALAATGHAQEAVDEYGAALELRPDDVDARLALAKALLAIERPELAARQYEQTLQRDPKTVAALVGLGVALTHMGRTEDALAAYRAALELDPNEPDAHNNLGFTLASSGRVAEAVPHFERALALNPGDENARRNLERSREVLGLRK